MVSNNKSIKNISFVQNTVFCLIKSFSMLTVFESDIDNSKYNYIFMTTNIS